MEGPEIKKDVYILAIESSCDETAAAVVKNGRTVLSNIISFFRSHLITINSHIKYMSYAKLSDYKSKIKGTTKLTHI